MINMNYMDTIMDSIFPAEGEYKMTKICLIFN